MSPSAGIAACHAAAHLMASTTLANSANKPSPVFLTMRPRCSAIFGSMLLRRSALSSGERTFLIGANEARVPGDIGREDRGEPSLDPFFAQGAPDQRRACSPNALVREEFALSTDPNQPQGAKAAANSLDEAGYRDNQEGQQLSKGSHPRRREPMTVWGRVQKPMRGRAELRYRRLAGAVTLPTDFRLPPENGHSRYALWTARFAPKPTPTAARESAESGRNRSFVRMAIDGSVRRTRAFSFPRRDREPQSIGDFRERRSAGFRA